MPKAVLFDFDGVLVDTEPVHYRAMLRTIAPMGAAPSYVDYVARFAGYDDHDCFRLVLGQDCGRPDLADDLQYIRSLCERKRREFSAIVADGVEMIPGARALVEALSGHVALAIASGAMRCDIDVILRGIGMWGQFPIVVSVDDVARPKPDPQTYERGYELLVSRDADLNLSPDECLAIEDTAAGIASAKGAGMMTLGVATTSAPEQLSGALRVVDGLDQLSIGQLEQWFG